VIEHLAGRLLAWRPDSLLVEVGGVGLRVRVSDGRRFAKRAGRRITLPVWLELHPRRAALFGFLDAEERSRFVSLVAIPGIGSATALKLLPHYAALAAGAAVPDVPGLGPARRARLARALRRGAAPTDGGAVVRDVARALRALGLSSAEARARAAEAAARRPGAPLEALIRAAVGRHG
jgi:Holliday junction DNA helicase RuvA